MLTLAAVLSLVFGAGSQQTGAVPTPGRFHLLRSTSGGRGTLEGDRYLIEDPRTVFYEGEDRQIVVFFEWQGPVGLHRCEGTWKDPSGNAVLTSSSEYRAQATRFGVYWTLSLPDTLATGTWVLEARVDGEPAGAHAFQILAGPRGPTDAPSRRALSLAELYKRAVQATLTVEGLDAAGTRVGTGSGLYVMPDALLTTFQAINAARSVRILSPDQRRRETSTVVSWNRRAGWALLRLTDASGDPPERAQTTPAVGDRCYFLGTQGDGSRVIVEASVLGRAASGDLVLSEVADGAAWGAPVFNEYGEVAGTIAGTSTVVGATDIDLYGLGSEAGYPSSARLRPLAPITDAGAASKSLDELDKGGEFVKPLARTPHFVSGVLGSEMKKEYGTPVASNQRWRFTRKDGQCVVFVTWKPGRKEDTTSSFGLFDEDGRQLASTDSKKLRLRSGTSVVQYWQINLAPLKPGVYRVDLFGGPDPVWRTFFRVTE